MVYGLIRPSSATSPKAEKKHIRAFIRKKKLDKPEWIEQTEIGNISYANRQLVSKMKSGDTLIVPRVIALSMHNKNLLDTLTSFLKKGCHVLIIQEDAVFPDPAISSQVQLEIFRTLQKLDKSILHEQLSRSRNALRKYKQSGRLGRPKGSSNKMSKLDGNEKEIQQLIDERISMSGIGRRFKVDRMTVKSYIKKKNFQPSEAKNPKQS